MQLYINACMSVLVGLQDRYVYPADIVVKRQMDAIKMLLSRYPDLEKTTQEV